MERHCPACGMAQPQHRNRCYNCNASLEQAPVVNQSEPPTEKRARPKEFWSDAYTPRPELTPKLPQPEKPMAALPDAGPRADEAAPFSRAHVNAAAAKPEARAPEPRPAEHRPPEHKPLEPPANNPHTGRLLRGGALAAEAQSFAPPPAKLRGRGSSGDPSEIAPRHTARVRAPGEPEPATGATPPPMPRPARVPGAGSSGERPASSDGTEARVATPSSGTPLERKRTTTSFPIPTIADGAAPPPPRPASGARPAPGGAPPDRSNETVTIAPGSSPTLDDVTQAIHAANEAARMRPRLSPEEVAAAARSFMDEMPDAFDEHAVPEDDLEAPPAGAGRATPPPTSSGPHYLIAQVLGEPVALTRSDPVRIGRSETNEIVFPLTQISRVHAEVRWDPAGSAFVVIDRNSTNGTFVNGKPVKRRRLIDGDRIAVGPFTLVYRMTTGPIGGAPRTRSGEDTEVVKPGALSGDLDEMPLPDVLRFIESLKKTGELTVRGATGERGTLYCREGQPVHAEWRDQIGIPAALSILRVKQGSFRFAAKPVQIDKATVMVSLTLLLKDALNPPQP